jgi:V8-like Glu-specific endopeptidase
VRAFPNDCVGVLHFRTSHGQLGTGTGFLIASDLVLTVAHSIYSRKLGERYREFLFYPGVSGDLPIAVRVKDIRYPKEFESCLSAEQLQYDYALLKLEGKVMRSSYIELGVGYVNQQEPLGLVGYPGVFCNADSAVQRSLWKASTHQVAGDALQHKLSTLVGNSGSPLLVRRGDKFFAVAIHKGAPATAQVNCGRIITKELMGQVIAWEKEMASEIRFSIMGNSRTSVAEAQPQEWLASVKLQIKVLLEGLSQPASFPKELPVLLHSPPKKA